MHAHPHPDRLAGRPPLGAERLLGVQDGRQCCLGRSKCGAEGITDGLEHEAASLFDGSAEYFVVAAEGLRHELRFGFPEFRRTFDVGKEQRDRSRGDPNRLAHVPKDTRILRR